MINENDACPCGLEKLYSDCCGRFHTGIEMPVTAEELMRSRYTAYAVSDFEYLLDTTFNNAANHDISSLRDSNNDCKWVQLEILSTEAGNANDETGVVEFVAAYFSKKHVHFMRERSRFNRRNGLWMYLDGEAQSAQEAIPQSKSAPCFCGSKKKFKRCHGK